MAIKSRFLIQAIVARTLEKSGRSGLHWRRVWKERNFTSEEEKGKRNECQMPGINPSASTTQADANPVERGGGRERNLRGLAGICYDFILAEHRS